VVRESDGRARYRNRPPSLVDALRASVRRDPSAPALVEVGGSAVDYGELWDRSSRVAGGLRSLGIARGDRVAIHMANGIDWVLAFFAVQMLGGVVVPVNTRFTAEEAAELDERCRTAKRSNRRSSGPRISRQSSTRAARRAFPRVR